MSNNNFNIVWFGPKLYSELDFSYWEFMMTTHLKAHNIWSYVESGLQQGANELARRRDQLALSQILQGIDY
jgi:hypothetical protein